MRNLALAAISTAVVAVGLSSIPASAFTFQASPPPDYALPDAGYTGGGSDFAPGGPGYAPGYAPAPFVPLAVGADIVGGAANAAVNVVQPTYPTPAPAYGQRCDAISHWAPYGNWPMAVCGP
jgi:hypothetical protein